MKILSKLIKMFRGKFLFILGPLLIGSTAISIYSWSIPETTTELVDDNISRIETSYDYKAKIKPNILYPEGGVVEAESMIFKKITTDIPFNLKSVIHSNKEVLVKGSYEVELLIKAGDFWERAYQLEQEQKFESFGTEIPLINSNYNIDLERIKSFIMQVEEETEIKPSYYTIEIIPNIQGVIEYTGKEMIIDIQDKLVFQYQYDIITLTGDKGFPSLIPFTTTYVLTNSFNVFGHSFSLSSVRITSIVLSVLLLIFVGYLVISRRVNHELITSQIDKINKRHKNRIIPVTHKIDYTQKTLILLDSFQSILKIADEKALPILFYEDRYDESAFYFIVDGDCVFSFETCTKDTVKGADTGVSNDKAYAIS